MAWHLGEEEDRTLTGILEELNLPFERRAAAPGGPIHFRADGDSARTVAEALRPLSEAPLRSCRIVYEASARAKLYDAWGLPISPGRAAVMGVLNVTPDSFYDGGRYDDTVRAIAQGAALADEGADIIDVGGESTRPGSEEVDERLEIARVAPVIRELHSRLDVPISIDTRKCAVAVAAVEAGAAVINDVTALRHDPDLARVAAESGAGLVLSHIRGDPSDMQRHARYDDVVAEVCDELMESAELALAAGVKEEKIVLDPGIGFGKRPEHSLRLIRDLFELRSCGFPILLGPSRKSFLGAVLDLPAEERLEGTLAACAVAVRAGTDIFRVHDVRAALRAVRVAEAIDSAGGRSEWN